MLGYEARSKRKLKASDAGRARMTMTVSTYLSTTGASGVPKGLVDAKISGHGRRPCRAISRRTRA